MHRQRLSVPAALLLLALASAPARAQVGQSKYLYTAPDPAASGGLRGTVPASEAGLAAVLALPPDEPRFVYKATLSGPSFAFTGLPARKYDLVVVCGDAVYEGLNLHREASTLTPADTAAIGTIIDKTEPFFNEKTIHRVLGKTGKMEGQARAFCTFLRSKSALGFFDGKEYTDHRRSLKLVLLEDVGPSWQVARTREIFVLQVKPGTGHIRHVYAPGLGGIRVVDSVKDMGVVKFDGQTQAAADQAKGR